nr:hypothetical protein [Tanacetum cinerariifolium]
LLREPTEGYAEVIMVPLILAEQFELKHSLINMMTSNQFFGLEKENPHDHIRAARRWLEKEPLILFTLGRILFPNSSMNSSPSRTTNLPDQDSLNAAAGGNLLERRTQDVLMIIKKKSKIAKLTHAVNQQTSAVTTIMTSILKQFQETPPPAFIKAVEEILVTCGGAHPYYQFLTAGGKTFPELRDNIQGYVSAVAVSYNQGNFIYRPPGMANQIRPPGFAQPNVQSNQNRFGQPQGFNRGNNFNPKQSYQAPTQQNQNVSLNELEKVKRMNEANMKAMQTQINMVKNELRNEMKNSIQASFSNHTNKIKNMMASLFHMNTASTSGLGSLPFNTVANPKGELKAITTQSGRVLDGPTISTLPPFINPKEDECVEETLTDPDLAEYTIKVPPPPVQKYKPPSQREYVMHQRDPLHLNIPYSSTLLSNKEKLQELANTPLNENCLAVFLKKLPEKLRDPGKFLISCGFSELKCKALADLANRAICTPAGIARDVFVPVGKFTFPADFVIIDYESDSRVHLILGRPFLWTANALIGVHGEEMILHDDFDSTKDLHPPLHDNPLSGSTTYSSSPNPLLEELSDELALITFPLKYDDDLQFDVDNLANHADNFVDSIPEMLTNEHALDYSSPSIFDEYDDDFLEVESDTKNVYGDPLTPRERKSKSLNS